MRLLCAVAAIAFALATAGAATAATPGAFTAPDDAGVPVLIKSLRGCIGKLPAADRRVLTLRSGLGGRSAELTAAIAATLGLTPAAANAAEVTAIRRLEAQRRAGACQPQAASSSKPAAAKAPTKKAAAATPASSAGDSSIGALGVIAPALLILAFVAGISLELRRQGRPPGSVR